MGWATALMHKEALDIWALFIYLSLTILDITNIVPGCQEVLQKDFLPPRAPSSPRKTKPKPGFKISKITN
jgi:hypothetical protein